MYIIRDIMYIVSSVVMRHKHLRIDQRKLDKARRVLGAITETEALDRALTLVVSEGEINAALRRTRAKATLESVFD